MASRLPRHDGVRKEGTDAMGVPAERRERPMTTEDYGLARRMWHQLEPVHALFWYAPQVFAAAAGLVYDTQTRWPSYFAWRLAPLGSAGPAAAPAAPPRLRPAPVGPPLAPPPAG